MKLMAIDASTKSTGIAIFKDDELIHYECLTSTSTDVLRRIKFMRDSVEKLYNKFSIDTVVMEDVLPEDVRHNQQVFNSLHYLQAAIVLRMHDLGQKVQLVNVNSWRKTCGITTGCNGSRALVKAEDIAFVKEKYNVVANDDICDAICIGWSALQSVEPEVKKTKKVTKVSAF